MGDSAALWRKVVERSAHARRCGALLPIATECEHVEQAGIEFVVRVAPALARKRGAAAPASDPFLPHDPDLFVADLSATHLCLLNKFSVLDHHLLVVTRAFEDQTRPLTRTDFEALGVLLGGLGGLGFYNAGRAAGASQAHKHLQWVPLPLGPGPEAVPIEARLRPALQSRRTSAELGFLHGLRALEPADAGSPDRALEAYRSLLGAVGADPETPPHYNLLMTPDWMLLVPRARERYEGIDVNALGFAGALLVRDRGELALLRSHGPLKLLQEVCFSERRPEPAGGEAAERGRGEGVGD